MKIESILPDKAVEDGYWDIAGIQHEIFIRVFSNLRHELVSPLSISRMTASMLIRNLDTGKIDKDIISDQIRKIDQQILESVKAIRALQLWDGDQNIQEDMAAVVRQGLKLSATRLNIGHIKIEVLPADMEKLEKVEYLPFIHVWLGVLCHLEDSLSHSSVLNLEYKHPKAFLVRIVSAAATHKPSAVARQRVMDRASLLRLASHHSISLQFSENQVLFEWQ